VFKNQTSQQNLDLVFWKQTSQQNFINHLPQMTEEEK
jgi:hypothetical protein